MYGIILSESFNACVEDHRHVPGTNLSNACISLNIPEGIQRRSGSLHKYQVYGKKQHMDE